MPPHDDETAEKKDKLNGLNSTRRSIIFESLKIMDYRMCGISNFQEKGSGYSERTTLLNNISNWYKRNSTDDIKIKSGVNTSMSGRKHSPAKSKRNIHVVKRFLDHGKKEKGCQFFKLWKGYPEHDETWKATKEFIIESAVNDTREGYIAQKGNLAKHQ